MRTPIFALVIVWTSINSSLALDLEAAAQAFHNRNPPVLIAPLRGWKGYDSGIPIRTLERIIDAERWQKFWASHAPGTPPPAIDFSGEMVVALTSGRGQGDDASLHSVTNAGGVLEIAISRYFSDVLLDRSVLSQIAPYLFIVLPRWNGPIAIVNRGWSPVATPQLFYKVDSELPAIAAR